MSYLRMSALILFLSAAALRGGEEKIFQPAFEADAIDFAQTRQFLNGAAAAADAEKVKRALGLAPTANAEENQWLIAADKAKAESTYHFLLVLKEPVAVGTICANEANMGANKGSRNGGEVYYLNADAGAAPDINDAKQWTKIDFAPVQPFLRFATLPPALKARAFLYMDVRSGGAAMLTYWRFYKKRLFSVTPTSRGFSDSAKADQDPDAIAKGESWNSGTRTRKITEKDPAWCVIAWEKPQALSGLFLFSNSSAFKLQRYKGNAGSNPAVAPEQDWEPVDYAVDSAAMHNFQYWAYSCRWLSFAPVTTAALRIQLGAVERGGAESWISGLGAFIDLKDGALPVAVKKDNRPPFRIQYPQALTGEASAALNGADGKRVRNLFAQQNLAVGTADEAWDLKDDEGKYVAPGTYKFQAIAAPALGLEYQVTPAPNVDQLWPDRTPWLTGHDGANGWLSDHSQFWACTTRGDRVYFAAPMAESGVTFIECDLSGKKLWGKHDFGAWVGVEDLAADEKGVYINAHGTVYRMDPATREIKQLFQIGGGGRDYQYRAMAARDGKIYMVFSENSSSWLENAAGGDLLDLAHCLPQPDLKNDKHVLPFILRMGGMVPGINVDPNNKQPQGTGRLFLESTNAAALTQNIVIAFNKKISLGSLVFPRPATADEMEISVLKPDATYPPKADNEDDWQRVESKGTAAWDCIPTPPKTETRAIRFVFLRKGVSGAPWFAKLEGLKLLRRRFANIFPEAKIRLSSGAIGADGTWDAKRDEALGPNKPGVMLLEWDKAKKIRGLAIKEIDGARTEIDVWNGPDGAIPMDGAACDKKKSTPGWRNVATYMQVRRTACYQWSDNYFARYIDGYVDFGEEVDTRAIRLRVIEQWYDNGDKGECSRAEGPLEHGVHYTRSSIMNLDPRRCRIRGVAVLQYQGGETPVDSASNKRIGVYDGLTGKALREIPCALGWHGLSFGPTGDLFGIAEDHRSIVKIDQETGKLTPAVANITPSVMTVGPDGNFYVRPWNNDGKDPLQVFDPQGKLLHTIGKPGGLQPGAWDPQRFGDVHRLCVDKEGSVWVLEAQNEPRRLVQYKTDGTFVKEIIGNTCYGGAGTLNRFDKTRAYHGRVEFEIDWEKHTSKIHGLLANGIEGDLVAYRIKDRTYLASTPLSMSPQNGRGIVYLYDDKTGTVRLVAAMGDATGYAALQSAGVITLLKGGVPRDFKFLWYDKNGNGAIDPEEVLFEKKSEADRYGGGCRFDEDLGCVCFGAYCSVKDVLPDGTPVYEKKPMSVPGQFRMKDGNFLTLHQTFGESKRSENFMVTPAGAKVWGYPATGGVSGLSVPPWTPGLVSNQFSIIGHETAAAGGLGEFFVTHANTGQWFVWSSDGLLAGQIMLHKGDMRGSFFGPSPAPPGTRLDPLSGAQEHFHGFFTKTESDGKYYIVAGFNHMSLLEVKGLDRFQRASADVTVTDDDLRKAREWEVRQVQRKTEGKPPLIMAKYMALPPDIDGKREVQEWGPDGMSLRDGVRAKLNIGYDNANIYFCWTVNGLGLLKNKNDDFHRLYKTGACLDVMLGTDPAADPSRSMPAAGDLRLLFTIANGKPKVVLYQPVAKNAKPGDAWKTFTQAAGATAFERVVELGDAAVMALPLNDGYVAEASVPLAALGLAIKPGLRLKMDWGVLSSTDGVQVKDRLYWSNKLATGTSDESVEARLEPGMWGYIGF